MIRQIKKLINYVVLGALVLPSLVLAMPGGAFAAENIAPEVAITQPLNGAYVSNNSSIVVEGTASDTDGTVISVDIRITNVTTNQDWDGSAWVAAPCWLDGGYSSGFWGGYIIPSVVNNNQYTITAQATDDQASVKTASINLTGDTVAPVTGITTANGTYVNNTVAITGTAVDSGSGISKVEIKQSASLTWEIANGTSNWNYNFTVPAADGERTQYDFDVRSTDSAVGANVETTVKHVTLIKDSLAPEIFMDPSNAIFPEGATVAYDSKVVFQGVTEPGLSVQVEVNSDPIVHKTISTATGEWRFEVAASDLGEGEHSAEITVVDEAGNVKTRYMTFWVGAEIVEEEVAAQEAERLRLAAASTQEVEAVEEAVTSTAATQESLESLEDAAEEVAEGIIKAAETQEEETSNPWQTVVTVIAILIIAIGVGTAGYYGYEWWATRDAVTLATSGPADDVDDEWDVEPVAKKTSTKKKSSKKTNSRKTSKKSSSRW